MKILQLTFIALLFSFNAVSQCSKDLVQEEKYSTGPILQSKDITFDSPTITNTKDISWTVKDSSRLFVHIDITYGTYRVGSKVDLILESGVVISTYISKWEKEVKGSYSAKKYDCQIMSRDDVDKLYIENIRKIRIHSTGKTYELSKKKRQKVNRYYQCTANTVGIENINFHPAKKLEADPYNENTIVVSFGSDQADPADNYDDIKCEYETNKVDEFTGDKTTITKWASLADQLQFQVHHINGKTFLNFKCTKPLGCANVESFIILKFADASTLKFMNLGGEDCGGQPIVKIEITDKMSILKVRDLEKVRISLSDAYEDVTLKSMKTVKGTLNKCI